MTKIVHIRRFPVKGGFYAINLFSIIFTIQELSAVELNHERIHTAHQRELFFVGFYLWYVVEWLFLLVKFRNGIKAYFNIRFEKTGLQPSKRFELPEASASVPLPIRTTPHQLSMNTFMN